VDALLQMADIYKQHGEFATASDFVARALFRLEASFHAGFRPWTRNTASVSASASASGSTAGGSADCRLDFDVPANKALFVALYRHVQLLGRKGACRAATECCKLLLSLAPDTDPLCALLLVDHFALRAKEYEWLVAFVAGFRQVRLRKRACLLSLQLHVIL
jgi:hypothetical protein